MKISNLFIPAFVISSIAIFTGALLKILHIPGATELLTIGLLLILVFIFSALYEIYSSNRINLSEKIMWTTAFIVFTMLAAILYLAVGRPRLMRQHKLLQR